MKYFRDGMPGHFDYGLLIAALFERLGTSEFFVTDEKIEDISAGRLFIARDEPRMGYRVKFRPFTDVIEGEVVEDEPLELPQRRSITDGR